MTFRGERSFSGPTLAALLQELNRYASAITEKFASVDRGGPRLWKKLPDTSSNTALAYGHIVKVKSGANVTLSLPFADPSNAGKELGVLREGAFGSIQLIAIGGTVDGGASITLPTTVGLYVLVCDGTDHWRVQ